jgi:hypothetical protein
MQCLVGVQSRSKCELNLTFSTEKLYIYIYHLLSIANLDLI